MSSRAQIRFPSPLQWSPYNGDCDEASDVPRHRGGRRDARSCGGGTEIERHAAHHLARRGSGCRSVPQQPAHRPDRLARGLGHAGLSRSHELQDRAGARHLVGDARCTDDGLHAAPRREVSQRRSVLGRRCGLHIHDDPERSEGFGAEQLRVHRRGGEAGRYEGAGEVQVGVSGSAGILRHVPADLPEGISGEGRRRGILEEADRHRAVSHHRGQRFQQHRVRTVRGLLQGQPEGPARDQVYEDQ